MQDLTPGLADKFKLRESRGVLITKVEPGSLAQSEGLQEGDLIKEVNRVEVGSVGEFSSAVSKVRRGETILLRVLRESRAVLCGAQIDRPLARDARQSQAEVQAKIEING